jgi:hypothetical protein
VAAVLIGSVVGISDLSPARILVGSIACATGWLLGSVLFGVWIELGLGAWLVAGAFLGAAFGAYRRWWMVIPAMLLGLVAGLLAEVSRYLTVLMTALRGVDMQFLLLLSAGLLAVVSWRGSTRPSTRASASNDNWNMPSRSGWANPTQRSRTCSKSDVRQRNGLRWFMIW